MDFGEGLNLLAIEFPKHEQYNLSSQIRRAGDSIALNISEGSILQSTKEFKKFMGYAIRSLAEVVTCFHKARRREYISENEFSKYSFNKDHILFETQRIKKRIFVCRIFGPVRPP